MTRLLAWATAVIYVGIQSRVPVFAASTYVIAIGGVSAHRRYR